MRTRRAFDAVTLGRRRRARAMNQRLAELDRLEFGAMALPREPRARGLVTLIVLAVAIAAGLSLWLLSGSGSVGHRPLVAAAGEAAATEPQARVAPRILDAPTHTHVDRPTRLLPVVTATGASSYRLFSASDAVRWQPCRAIHYVTHHGGEGAALDAIFRSAVGEVTAATGLKFVNDGATPELPLLDPSDRLPYQPRVYGDRWAPVLVSWSNAVESPELAGTVEGFAGPLSWHADIEPARYVSGTVTLDVEKLRALRRGSPGGVDKVRTVLLHELGHLIGLAHIKDRSQVMYPSLNSSSPKHYGAGDRAGLALLGRGPCYSDF
jgi:Matrixin